MKSRRVGITPGVPVGAGLALPNTAGAASGAPTPLPLHPRKGRVGFTLVEVMISLAIAGFLTTGLVASLSLLLTQSPKSSAKLAVENRHQLARYWLIRDANSAEDFTPGVSPTYGAFTWRDFSGESTNTYAVRYFYDATIKALMREEKKNNVIQSTDQIAADILLESDVAFAWVVSQRKVTVTIIPTIQEAPGVGDISRTAKLVAFLRFEAEPFKCATGSYTGNGTANRAIKGTASRPDAVIIRSLDSASQAVMRTSTMTGDQTKRMTSPQGLADNRIKSLDDGGFTLGSNPEVNQNGVTFHWMAFAGAGGQLKVGTYNGNGTTQSISLDFSPDYVVLLPSDSARASQRFFPASGTSYFGDRTNKPQLIVSLNLAGFTVGSSVEANQTGVTYHYAAWNASGTSMGFGTYAGNGTDNRSIPALGFLPDYVIVKGDADQTALSHPASLGASTDSSLPFIDEIVAFANGIQALESDGFQVGTHPTVNQAGITYFWVGFKCVNA